MRDRTFSKMRRALLVACAGAFLAGHVQAQPQVVPETVFTVGTSIKDLQGRRWAYVLWQATDQGLVIGKTFALYAKAGDASSANPYELKAVAGLQTEPLVIQTLLNRAANLGENIPQLNDRLSSLFVGILPPGDLPVADKLSAVIRGSLGKAEFFNNVVLLGRLHPGVNLCLGYAHAELVPAGKTTFEVREYDKAQGKDIGVIGRVTIEGDAPLVLPAPGGPVRVPETDDLGNINVTSAKGDLNVKLRWATSAQLRRLSLLNYGFNVWRMTKAFAESQGYHVAPPTPAALNSLAGHPSVRRVNQLPVLKTRDFDAVSVANFAADATTIFFADDNGRYREGGQAFQNGDQYYYFITGRDILGRDGLVSPGTLITICDRMPPDAPRGLQVLNDYSYNGVTNKQVLKLRWLQHTNTAQDNVTAYYVYRWANPSQVQTLGGNPLAHRIAGPIAHVPGLKFAEFVDTTPGSAQAPADYGKTIWYTVRSVDDGACDGGNLSPNSTPAFGVLRDRTGPEGPDGGITILCCLPQVTAGASYDEPSRDPQNEALAYDHFVCARKRPEILWAEFYIFGTASSNLISRSYFPQGADKIEFDWTIARNLVDEGFINFYCRVGTVDGEESTFAQVQTTRAPKYTTVRFVPFESTMICRRIPQRGGATGQLPCRGVHNPQPGGPDDPSVEGPDITIQLTPGTKEYRLYRRVDFGPLTLVKQGPADFDDVSQIQIPDNDMPANSGFICYYAQLFDEHGNASPLVQIGDCFAIKLPTATPMLSPLEAVGDTSAPKMKIRWFCPPFGIERFEVAIANELGIMPVEISTEVSPQTPSSPKLLQYSLNGVKGTNTFGLYRTPLVGPAFGNGAMFEVTVNISLGFQYTVMVAAVDKSGTVHKYSNAQQFLWAPPPPAVGPDVPWPARPLPPLNLFHAQLQAVRLPDLYFKGTAIRIADIRRELLMPQQDNPKYPGELRTHVDPMTILYTNKLGQRLFPVVVYRMQLANAEFPKVSGDLTQVTPLMEEIAYEFAVHPTYGNETIIHDPFIRTVPGAPGTTAGTGAMYLVDTQPVLAGANYIYLLVRLAPNGEILEVIPTNTVLVTP